MIERVWIFWPRRMTDTGRIRMMCWVYRRSIWDMIWEDHYSEQEI